ncbi:hypothetical protein ACHAW6_003740 [Cyclotella cf. meneghiniana]
MPKTALALVSVLSFALLCLLIRPGNRSRRDFVVTHPQNQQLPPKFKRKLVEDEITYGPLLNEEIITNSDKTQEELTPEEITEKQIKQYLGGLYPKVDRNFMPIYLRDTLQPRKVDPKWGEIVDGDIPFFWHIPKASGSTMSEVIATIYNSSTLVRLNASPLTRGIAVFYCIFIFVKENIMNFCFNLKRAEKVYGEASTAEIRPNIINMDVSSPEGLKHAYESNLLSSNIIDVLVSNYFTSGSALFTPEHQGRAFTIMRHPIDLAESLFHYRKKASWETSYRPDWNKITFSQYVASDEYIGNWMVHQLTGTMPWVELTEEHLTQAKSVLQAKVFVGIASQMDETLRQLKRYFHWIEEQPFCVFNYLHSTPTNSNSHPKTQRGSAQWLEVAEKEKWDLSLYYYALELFAQQRERFPPEDRASEALVSVMDPHQRR